MAITCVPWIIRVCVSSCKSVWNAALSSLKVPQLTWLQVDLQSSMGYTSNCLILSQLTCLGCWPEIITVKYIHCQTVMYLLYCTVGCNIYCISLALATQGFHIVERKSHIKKVVSFPGSPPMHIIFAWPLTHTENLPKVWGQRSHNCNCYTWGYEA